MSLAYVVFTTYFHGWQTMRLHHLEEKPSLASQQFDTPLRLADDILSEFGRKYTYEELSTGAYPKGLDAKNLEVVLSAHVSLLSLIKNTTYYMGTAALACSLYTNNFIALNKNNMQAAIFIIYSTINLQA